MRFSWSGGWRWCSHENPRTLSLLKAAWRFMFPQSIETWQDLYKVCTWAYTPEINWETRLIYSNNWRLNCIFFFTRTINSFPFSDWIHKSKEHTSWTNYDYETPILHLSIPKTLFTHAFSSLHCSRTQLSFSTLL